MRRSPVRLYYEAFNAITDFPLRPPLSQRARG